MFKLADSEYLDLPQKYSFLLPPLQVFHCFDTSGLAAALYLKDKDSSLKVVVLEARSRVGGRTCTEVVRMKLNVLW